MSKAPEKPKKYEERLMEAFDFDEDDVEANRAGRLSPVQVVDLKSRRNRIIAELALLSFSGVIMTMVLFIMTSSSLPSLAAGILAIGTLFLAYGVKIRRLLTDIQENHPLTAEGRINLVLKHRQNANDYFMHIGDISFPIQENRFLALKNGDPYCIYYAPHSKRILSVEWLRDDNPFVADEADADEDTSDADGETFTEPRQQTQPRPR